MRNYSRICLIPCASDNKALRLDFNLRHRKYELYKPAYSQLRANNFHCLRSSLCRVLFPYALCDASRHAVAVAVAILRRTDYVPSTRRCHALHFASRAVGSLRPSCHPFPCSPFGFCMAAFVVVALARHKSCSERWNCRPHAGGSLPVWCGSGLFRVRSPLCSRTARQSLRAQYFLRALHAQCLCAGVDVFRGWPLLRHSYDASCRVACCSSRLRASLFRRALCRAEGWACFSYALCQPLLCAEPTRTTGRGTFLPSLWR